MSTISFDGQSLLIDGRRVWLVSGAMHYNRIPRELWRDRIRAARQAGLNCIETYVFWNLHEPRPGRFDFTGQNDLRHYIELIAEEGMYCWLRPGPYVCAEWDFGGLPPWLLTIEGLRLREHNGPFLEASSRYLGAVLEQVRDLQVNQPQRGPIVLMQAENEWFCHNPDEGHAYLREIVRYLLENGCTVPINICNNLWQQVEGTIDTWNAARRLTPDLRQLQMLQRHAPRMVSEYWPGWFDAWNAPHDTHKTADINYYRLAGILAAGAQYNLYMFHGGTNFGFYGGRTIGANDRFMTTSYDYDAPLLEAGGRGEKYLAVKRISTFASHFDFLFGHLEPDHPPTAIYPDEGGHPPSVIHQTGSQGDVIFVLRDPADRKTNAVELMLPNGLKLPVNLGNDTAAWCVYNVKLSNGILNYTNLRPWALIQRKLLVLFGPAGTEGVICLNDAINHLKVPTGQTPLVDTIEDFHVVVLNEEQVDAAYVMPEGLVVGANGLDVDDQPVPHAAFRTQFTIAADTGELTRRSVSRPQRKPTTPQFDTWTSADVQPYVDGSAQAYQPIDGPQSFEALGNDFGYGWYRFDLPQKASGRMLLAEMRDRLHLFEGGQPVKLIGVGAGVDAGIEPTPLKFSNGPVVGLCDNLGRFNYGWGVGERKGLYGHIYPVKSINLTKAKQTTQRAPDPFEIKSFWKVLRKETQPIADRLTWTFKPTARNPVVLDLSRFTQRVMVLINDQPIDMFCPAHSGGIGRWVFEVGQQITGGKNTLALAFYQPLSTTPSELAKLIDLYACAAPITGKAAWSFAPFVVPDAATFSEQTLPAGLPCWHRTQFNITGNHVPLWFDASGLSKGQLYLNGRNLGRYWVSTSTGKAVPPQKLYYLPEPWLRSNEPNELMIFDEHGKRPHRCGLVYNAMGPYTKG